MRVDAREVPSEVACAPRDRVAEEAATALCRREGDGGAGVLAEAPPTRIGKAAVRRERSLKRLTGDTGAVRLTERQMMLLAMEESQRAAVLASGDDFEQGGGISCPRAIEPASSKDTTTLDMRANSPRNSKSSGNVSQRKGSLEGSLQRKDVDLADCSLSSLSDQAKEVPGGVLQPETPRAGSDVSNHSRLQQSRHFAAAAAQRGSPAEALSPSSRKRLREADDTKEADSHHTPRSKDLQATRAGGNSDKDADSGSHYAQEAASEQDDIQSHGPYSANDRAKAAGEPRENGKNCSRKPLGFKTANSGKARSLRRKTNSGKEAGVETTLQDPVQLSCEWLDTPSEAEKAQRKPKVKQGIKRPRSLKLTTSVGDDGVRVKAEVTDECPPTAQQLDSDGPLRPASAFSATASLKKGSRPVAVKMPQLNGHVLDASLDEESLSRACSAVPGSASEAPTDDGGDDEDYTAAVRKPPQKKQRSKPERRGSQTLLQQNPRRSGRVPTPEAHDALDAAAAEVNHRPPCFDLNDALPVAGAKRPRATRTRSTAAPKPPPAPSGAMAGAVSMQRANSRLRWSGSLGSLASPLGSPSGSRRLRSQPLDISCLVSDAFACDPPPKRSKHSALMSGVAAVRQLESRAGPYLAESQSGQTKPYPAWKGSEAQQALSQLQETAQGDCNVCLDRHSAEIKLLEQLPEPPSCGATAEHIAQGRLGKAMRKLSETQAATQASGRDALGVLQSCKRLLPECLNAACTSWAERLNAPCTGMLGETSTFLKARCDRDLQNIWDDLLARHYMETATLESFSRWLAHKPAGQK